MTPIHVEVAGGRLLVVDEGSGRPIVLQAARHLEANAPNASFRARSNR